MTEEVPKFIGFKINDFNLTKKKYIQYCNVDRDIDLDKLNEEVANTIGITIIDLIYDKEKRFVYKPGKKVSHCKPGHCIIVAQGCRKSDSRMVALIASSIKQKIVVVNLSDMSTVANNEITVDSDEMDDISSLFVWGISCLNLRKQTNIYSLLFY